MAALGKIRGPPSPAAHLSEWITAVAEGRIRGKHILMFPQDAILSSKKQQVQGLPKLRS